MDRISAVADASERLDVKVSDGPQLRWVYLTAWATEDSRVHFRPDVYELDTTGFVVGQPLPLGQGQGSLRWTMEPIPYGEDSPDVFLDLDVGQLPKPEKQKAAIPKTTNFKPKKRTTSLSTLTGERSVPSFGQQDAN